jgi:hypothetical protein
METAKYYNGSVRIITDICPGYLPNNGVIGIATRYGLDHPTFEPWLLRGFPYQSRPSGNPTYWWDSRTVWTGTIGAGSLARGVKRWGRCVDHPPHSSAEVKERVKLCLNPPSVSSWHVTGWLRLYRPPPARIRGVSSVHEYIFQYIFIFKK